MSRKDVVTFINNCPAFTAEYTMPLYSAARSEAFRPLPPHVATAVLRLGP